VIGAEESGNRGILAAMKWRASVLVLVSWFVVGSARADLPPPAGKKQVSYSFEVKGLSASSDWVLLAHPYVDMSGDSSRRFAKVEDGKRMRVDRRNGSPKLYAMKKQAYEQWLAKYKPASNPMEDPAVEALFKSDQVVACNRNPEVVTLLDSKDPRSEVVEAFLAKTLDAKSCVLDLDTAAATPASAAPTAAPPPTATESAAPVASLAPAPIAPAPPQAPKPSGGCSGCAVPDHGGSRADALWLLAALPLLRRRRRA
jgi:hypothetical protein